jgi:integrase
MRTRHQKGYVYRKGHTWFVRYYDSRVASDGTIQRKQMARKLVEAEGEYRSKKSAQALADEFMASINSGRATPQSTMTLAQFVETSYLPFVEAQKRVSTFHGYRNIWKRYLKPHGSATLRDFRTVDGETTLQAVARRYELTSTTLQHVKAFLSGAFRYAKRLGVINSENPMRDVVLPKAKAATETHAYSLEQIGQMLNVLCEPAATIVAAAAFTGARKGELRGMRWEDYDGDQILISRSIWRGHIQEPKTKKSKAAVLVIAQLGQRLELHRALSGDPATGLMFHTTAGGPLDLDALAYDVIRPALQAQGLQWHGWHAFRRGLATNLHRLGVQDETIQRILRHSNVSVTQDCYIKTPDAAVVEAMRSLENAPSMHLGSVKKSQLM